MSDYDKKAALDALQAEYPGIYWWDDPRWGDVPLGALLREAPLPVPTPAEPGLREETFDELWDRTAALARANGLSLEEVTRGWRGTGYLAATLRRDNGGEDGCGVRDRDAEGDTPTAALRNLAAALSESGKGETE